MRIKAKKRRQMPCSHSERKNDKSKEDLGQRASLHIFIGIHSNLIYVTFLPPVS